MLRRLEASAPKNNVEQMDFGTLEDYQSPAVPRELMDKLEALDLETLTPIEALNFLYELKKTLKGSLSAAECAPGMKGGYPYGSPSAFWISIPPS